MSERDLLDLEYAALMHDIGQFSSPGPFPGGAMVFAAPDEQRRIAECGAEMIRQVDGLDQIARIVSRQYEPYQPSSRPGSGTQAYPRPPPQLASRIIKVVNAYDDIAGETSDPDRIAAILELLRLASGSNYDPVVVDALRQVLATRPPD